MRQDRCHHESWPLITQFDLVGVLHAASDHLGTSLLQTDPSANVYWRMEQEPYGKVWALRAGDVHQPLRLPGQVAEQFDTGANGMTERSYNNFRWYRPGWGRYSQEDPIGLAGGFNSYAFAMSSPAGHSDPLGLTTYIGWAEFPLPFARWYHSFIILDPYDYLARRGLDYRGKCIMTVAAGSSLGFNPLTLLDEGRLVSKPDKDKDPSILGNSNDWGALFELDPGSYGSDVRLEAAILAAEANFASGREQYAPIAGPGGYNSNSYLAGLLKYLHFNGTMLVQANPAAPGASRNPGSDKPVDSSLFAPPRFSSGPRSFPSECTCQQ